MRYPKNLVSNKVSTFIVFWDEQMNQIKQLSTFVYS